MKCQIKDCENEAFVIFGVSSESEILEKLVCEECSNLFIYLAEKNNLKQIK